ncbi:MAG: radical SAM protein [Pseudanabaenaceae cyanobacterium]
MSSEFLPVYGPVRSWRYGNSLGIDPIGAVSHCSFNCVYCQLGEIEQITLTRQLFVPTEEIINLMPTQDLQLVDVITLSGSGEPTLALNLGEILQTVGSLTPKPLIVLTNGSLLGDAQVRSELLSANEVSIKLDGITSERVAKINRPAFVWQWDNFWHNLKEFRRIYGGKLTIQTMFLSQWTPAEVQSYIEHLQSLCPDHIYLNVPRRPKPRQRLLAGRENLNAVEFALHFKPLSLEYLADLAQEIRQAGLTVSCSAES